METKICTKCGDAKSLDQYGPRRGVPHGLSKCKPCYNEYYRNYYKKNPDKNVAHNRHNRAKRYGLTIEQVIQFETAVCNICGEGPVVIDHCHTLGNVRGALCQNCNSGLGFFRDRPDLLDKAIDYLRLGVIQ